MVLAKHWSSFTSGSTTPVGSSTKRQKITAETELIMDSGMKTIDPNKNVHLKGRRRFMADFRDLEEECGECFVSRGLHIRRLRSGDEEGSFEVIIENEAREFVVALNLLVSDTTDYPNSHSLFCYASEGEVPPKLQTVIEDFATEPSRPVRVTLLQLLSRISRAIGLRTPHFISADHDDTEEAQDDDDDDDDYAMSSDDETINNVGSFTVVPKNQCDVTILQSNFIEVVAAGYRPAFIKHSYENFSITISVPILRLIDVIPPRALMAWDRALLSKTQHLCLLVSGFRGVYPVLATDGSHVPAAVKAGTSLEFKVGLTQRYKPGKEEARSAVRKHGLILDEEVVHGPQPDPLEQLMLSEQPIIFEEEEVFDPNRFDSFSLSGSAESLMNQSFLKLLQFRLAFGLNWGGAEKLLEEVERSQSPPQEVLREFYDDIMQVGNDEGAAMKKTDLLDPLHGLGRGSPINLPLTAFSYLVRRLSICPQYCLVCHRKLELKYEALKPYVCDSKLCAYQYYALNRGAPLEYEIIHNPYTVDLLVSLAFTAAAEGVLEDPPVGIALRVPLPRSGIVPNNRGSNTTPSDVETANINVDKDGLCDFDQLSLPTMRSAIITQLDSLPTIYEMRVHLTKKVSEENLKPKLQDMGLDILPAAWLILRWCVASCTAYLEEITNKDELVRGLDASWRQFRFNVGAPDAEAKFQYAIEEAQRADERARQFPVLYAFHGSPLRNWHSIIRHGLWFKTIANGRAYGHGVYLAKDGRVSSGSYSTSGQTWSKSVIAPQSCVALVEIINLPHKFVSQNPYFVVDQTHWLLCRYLLVKGREHENQASEGKAVPFVTLDDRHPITLGNKRIQIPEPSYKIQALLDARRSEYSEEDFDEEDRLLFSQIHQKAQDQNQIQTYHTHPSITGSRKMAPEDDWKHDPDYVRAALEHLLPPPQDSSTTATMALQRELRSMIKEQEAAPNFKELGWYMPPEFNEDNLFQWIVEMHSFDPDISIARDLAAKKLNSVVFEIRFPATFPHSPPFFRILKPRFLPFIQGGGGHVTGGGSICMDLLTADGWSPSYSIPAVLMQIKLAISNPDPRPARLDSSHWNIPYQMREALEGYIRAANTHNWRVPDGLQKLL